MNFADLHNAEKMNVKDTYNGCYFCIDHDDVSNNNKIFMFLLCWWFAVNLHLIAGSSNRIEMPACLVLKITLLNHEENRKFTCCKEKQ